MRTTLEIIVFSSKLVAVDFVKGSKIVGDRAPLSIRHCSDHLFGMSSDTPPGQSCDHAISAKDASLENKRDRERASSLEIKSCERQQHCSNKSEHNMPRQKLEHENIESNDEEARNQKRTKTNASPPAESKNFAQSSDSVISRKPARFELYGRESSTDAAVDCAYQQGMSAIFSLLV